MSETRFVPTDRLKGLIDSLESYHTSLHCAVSLMRAISDCTDCGGTDLRTYADALNAACSHLENLDTNLEQLFNGFWNFSKTYL